MSIISSITLGNNISCQLCGIFVFLVNKDDNNKTCINMLFLVSVCVKLYDCLFSVTMIILYHFYIFTCCHKGAVNLKIQLYDAFFSHSLSGQTGKKGYLR